MTTSKELCQLLRRLEKETLTVELKRSDILNNHDGSRDLAYEIVAFANRRGGKLILGVNNDGSFEGKSIFDVDRIKGRIDNICYQQISPIIDYKFNCLELDEGDVIVIDIPKKRGIPHAYIGKREGTEIKNRIYYIRTTHGKRLVSDNQLQWLFGQQEEDFTFDFRTIITHEKNFLNVRFPSMEQPQCLDNYYEVTNCLSSKIARNPIFKQDFAGDSQRTFFLGITPYALIHTLSSYFGDSWVIEVDRRRPYGKSHQIKSNLKGLQLSDIQKVSSSDLPRLSRNALLVNLNEEIINSSIAGHGRYEEPSFCVPSGTTISVEYEDRSISKRAKLVLANKNFEFVFLFEERGIKAGPAHGNPIWDVIASESKSNNRRVNDHELYKCCQSLEINGVFKANFNFPEEDVELFNKYYNYAKSIQEILESDWDYDQFIERLPSGKFYVIEDKLDTIIRHLKRE